MRRVLAASAFGAMLMVVAAPALSAGNPMFDDYILKWQDDPKVNCKSPDTTYDMNVCAGRIYKKTYTAMAKAYDELYAKYDAPNRKLLLASQLAWHGYQSAECALETAGTVGGTINSTMVTNCDAALAAERLKQLHAQLNCGEGDMSCNHP